MQTLEDRLRQAASKGLTHVSLWTVWTENKKQVFWAASAVGSGGQGYLRVEHTDPIQALTAVLDHLPRAKGVTAGKKREAQPGDRDPTEFEVDEEPTVNKEVSPDEDWMIK